MELIDRGALMNSLSGAWDKAELLQAIQSAPAVVSAADAEQAAGLAKALRCINKPGAGCIRCPWWHDATEEEIQEILTDDFYAGITREKAIDLASGCAMEDMENAAADLLERIAGGKRNE